MRETKFRAWSKKERKMCEVLRMDLRKKTVDIITEDTSYGEHGVSMNDVVLMQYTGLKDKNGVEIFEGDIITPSEKNLFAKIVGFDNFGLYLENVSDIKNREFMDTKQRPGERWWSERTDEITIIGNIHEVKNDD